MNSVIDRNDLTGKTAGGQVKGIPITAEGHLEVAVHSPILPFGSMHSEKLTPVFQSDAVYGITPGQEDSGSSLSGSASAANSMFSCSTGTTQYSQAYLQGVKRLRSRTGQGVVGRVGAFFSTPVAYSYQLVGFGHAEDGLYVGYGDTGELSEKFGDGGYNAEEITLQPGERISLLARTSTGNATYVTGSINTREDQ